MNGNGNILRKGRRGLSLALSLMLMVLALLPLSETAFAREAQGFSGDVEVQYVEPDDDEEEDEVAVARARSSGRNMSAHAELVSLSVWARNTEIYLYEEGESPTVTEVELSSDEVLTFELEWRATDDTITQPGDYVKFEIMKCDFFKDMDSQQIPIEKTNLEATGVFDFANSLVTYTMTIDSITANHSLTDGDAEGWAKLDVDDDRTSTTIRFRNRDSGTFPVENAGFGGGGNTKPKTGEVSFIKSDYWDGDKTGTVSESKFESLAGLAGVSFRVYEKNETTPLDFWETDDGYVRSDTDPGNSNGQTNLITTDEDGVFKLVYEGADLDQNYYLKEVAPLSGYYKDPDQEISFTPSSSQGQYYAIYNVPRTIRLKKVDADSGQTLSGVEFELYNSGGTRMTGFTWSEADGWYTYGSGSDTLKTNKDGILEIRMLPAGDYSFVESKPLDGYLPNETKYAFTIKDELDGEAVTTVITAKNVRYPFVEVLKQGVRGSQVSTLSNVSFTLSRETPEYSLTKTTGSDGKLVFGKDDLPASFAGTYTLRETAPGGYKGVGDITVVIKANGQIETPSCNASDSGQISWNEADRRLTVRNTSTSGGSTGSSGRSSSGTSTRDNLDRALGLPAGDVPLFGDTTTTIGEDDVPTSDSPGEGTPDTPGDSDSPETPREDSPKTGVGGVLNTAVLLIGLSGAYMVWNSTRKF